MIYLLIQEGAVALKIEYTRYSIIKSTELLWNIIFKFFSTTALFYYFISEVIFRSSSLKNSSTASKRVTFSVG